jgi:hypothetical protein
MSHDEKQITRPQTVSFVLPSGSESKDSANIPKIRSRNNSIPVDKEILEGIKDDIRDQGYLFDIGKPKYERRKEEIDKDLHDLISYNIEMGDGTECIRTVLMLLLSKFRNVDKFIEYMSNAYLNSGTDYRLMSFSACYVAYTSKPSILKECEELCLFEDSKMDESVETYGSPLKEWLLFSKLHNTYSNNMKFCSILEKWINSEYNLRDLVCEYIILMVRYYLDRYGYRLSICYISLFYRISILGHIDFNTSLGNESYLMVGIYDYRCYSTKGMFPKSMANLFLWIKFADVKMSNAIDLKKDNMSSVKGSIQYVPKANKGSKSIQSSLFSICSPKDDAHD